MSFAIFLSLAKLEKELRYFLLKRVAASWD